LSKPRRKRGERRKEEAEKRLEDKKLLLNFIFWNVVGLDSKEEEFWKYVCKYDFISLSET